MIITLLAGGSRGDTQPFIALGLELKRLGHTPRIVSHENFADFVRQFDLEFIPIRGDVTKVTASAEGMSALNADNPFKVLLSFNLLKKLIYDLQKDYYEACRGSDVIVYHPGPTIGYFAAQQMGIPAVLAAPFPMTPTRAFPSLLFYDKPHLGGTVNWLTHKVFEQIMWSVSGSPVRNFFKQEFGSPPKDFRSPFSRQVTRRNPTIISCSPSVFPRPADWSAHVHMPGYWFLDEEPDWHPGADLLDFLQRGAAPVYVGFGSVGDPTKTAETTQLVRAALRQAGQRGVLAGGWAGMIRSEAESEDIFFLESAPHAWLFPRMAAVAHHGGAGTTAAGFRAGVPSIFIPFANDQFAWGARAFELGVCPRPIPRKKLTVENLAQAFILAQSAEMRANAASLGERIRAENGVAAAAQVILAAIG